MEKEQLEKIKKLKAFQLLPTTASKDIEWINWMKELSSEFGRDTAVKIFLNLWNKRGTSEARTMQLRSFMKDKYNVDLGEGVLDKVADLGGDYFDFVTGIFHTGKTVVAISIGVTLLAGIGLVYALVKNPNLLMMATPTGRAASLIKK